MIPAQWREAIALALIFNLMLFGLFASFTEKRKNKDAEYIPVDVIRLSPTREKEEPPDLRPSAPAAALAPQSQLETKQEPPAEKELGLDKTGEEPFQPPTPAQTVYIPQHRVTRAPNFKTQVKPAYPSSERAGGVEARVLVEVYINEYGGVDDVKVINSGGLLFDQAVITAVKASSFSPGYLEGKTVAVRVQIPYVFKIR